MAHRDPARRQTKISAKNVITGYSNRNINGEPTSPDGAYQLASAEIGYMDLCRVALWLLHGPYEPWLARASPR